ncbi:MAG: hypothetical protein HOP08_13945 [Cyclobacteriaceae bacterium]|nr:hypothetical protein [Cyclobacteriaceae bacterium]
MRKSQLYSIAFGFSLLVLLFFSMLLYNSLTSYSEYSSLVEHTQVVMNNVQKMHSQVIDAETGQRGFLLTKDSIFLEPLLEARSQVPKTIDSLRGLAFENTLESKMIDTLRKVSWEKLQIMEETLNISPFISPDALTLRLKAGKVKMDKFRSIVNTILAEEQLLLVQRAKKKLEFERITPSYFKAIISITAVVSLISFVLLMQELKHRTAAQNLLESKFHSLNRSNAELQQIAYVTSHDLQEPLRKMRIFSDALIIKFEKEIPEEALAILKRVDANAARVRELVADLSSFTSLATPDGKITDVNLSLAISKAQAALSEKMNEKKGSLTIQTSLPIIKGYKQQLEMLFEELINNSIKFSKPEEPLNITIYSEIVSNNGNELLTPDRQYLMINFSDNGIGFESEYANKIFILFQKLHGQSDRYEGKGLGLSLCQRIMANHDGFITAAGGINEGATFTLYFPL